MRLRSNGLFVKPQLPDDVRQINIVGVGYLGNKINVSYDISAVLITLQANTQVTIAGRLLVTHGLQFRSSFAFTTVLRGAEVLDPLKKIVRVCDLCMREKDWRSCARGAKAA